MNHIAATEQNIRELNVAELNEVSGGVEYECKVTIRSDGTKEISCTVKGKL
ncbi:hypothetical protein [Massilia sp. ST3]|uniref:hypothetical protein n=1 Tax=Massilia sp. ST3 TaxID=2824903 RepID=UPI001B827816|nr:hypothetical protein [Massilia sp. ST3]MBQ5947989.1 hypothetical protein [Massilia sp. ST3]